MNIPLRRVSLTIVAAMIAEISLLGQDSVDKISVTSVGEASSKPNQADPAPRTVYVVESLAALQERITAARPGDDIVLKNGAYTARAAIDVTCVGTAEQPITITAEAIGAVEIGGSNGFKVGAPAEHVSICGFKFTHSSGTANIGDDTRYIRFTRNTFLCAGDGHYLSIVGDAVQIDYNEFGAKKFPGTMIAVSGPGGQVARRLWIHHNYFHDFENDGSNGAEMLRMGLLSSHRLSKGAALVEHNLFVRCRGVNDLISNRSSANTYRYNTFLDSPSAHLTVRQGDDCAIYGNVFRNTEGIRLYGDRHLVFSNYLEGNYVGVAIGNGTIEVSEAGNNTPPNSHDRPDDCVIAFNTFVENNTHFQMSRRSGGLGATNTTFANNLLQGGAIAAKIDGPNVGAVWSNNLVWKTENTRDLPAAGQITADPLLAVNADGLKRPQSTSPAFASAEGNFGAINVDFDGQPRPEKKSIGADEPSGDPVIARVLSVDAVGPDAKPNQPGSATAPATASVSPATL
jgi:poly(beta-D-mannuronate) lyase